MHSLLQDRRGKIIIGIVILIALCFLGGATWKDSLHKDERKIHSSFGIYREAMNKRASLVPEMLELLRNYAPQEQAISAELVKSYEDAMRYQPPEQILTNPKMAAEFFQLQKTLIENMNQAQSIAKNYPGLAENRMFYLLLNDWHEVNVQVTGSGELLNRYIQRYNNHLQGFPQNWYNKMTYRYVPKNPIEIPYAIR